MTPWTSACQAPLSFIISQSSLSLSSLCSSSQWYCITISSSAAPFSFCLQSFSASGSFPVSWLKYWSFSFSVSPSNEYSGLISFRIDWFDLLAVQGTLKSLLQHYSLKASILLHSAFFIVQLSRPYMTTGKTTALTRQTFVGKVMSLLFNTLSRFVIQTTVYHYAFIKYLTRARCCVGHQPPPPWIFSGSRKEHIL